LSQPFPDGSRSQIVGSGLTSNLRMSIRRLRLLLILGVCARGFCNDAPMFRGDPGHSGIYDAVGAPQTPMLKWKFKTRGAVVSSPAVVAEVLYAGSNDHSLYALNANSGTLKWRFRTGGRVASSPAVAGGLVYFGSYDGYFYAVDVAAGSPKWKFQTNGERRYAGKHLHGADPVAETMPDPFDFYLSSPTVVDGTVYFGSGDGNVYALDASSGTQKWKFQTGDVVHSSPAVADGVVYVGSWDTYFYAIDAASGKEKWSFRTGDDPKIHNQIGIQASPLIASGTVYFGCRDSNLYALDAHTGEKKWIFNNKGSWVIGSPAIKDGRLYFTTSDSGLFHAVEAATGNEIYTLQFLWPLFSSGAIAGNTLYIGSEEGKLLAIDLQTQHLAWSFQTDGSKTNGATFTKPDGKPNYDAAFTGDGFYDGMVVGVNRMLSVGMVLSSPIVVGETVYFGSTDGNLYAVK
jgi:eukaryotic-like serine/threonine-protein kinase